MNSRAFIAAHSLSATHPGIPALFAPGEPPNRAMLASTLRGHYPGLALADDPLSPSQCVVRIPYHGITFFSGGASDRFLEEAVEALRASGPVLLAVPEHEDARRLPPGGGTPSDRVEFSGRDPALAPIGKILGEVPPECRVVPMDRALLRRCLWREEVLLASGGDPDRFFGHGRGTCMLRGGDLVCEAYGVFVGDGLAELGVITHEAHQRRNCAAMTSAALIRDFESDGIQPRWSTDRHHAASIRVARKLGFTRERPYRFVPYAHASAGDPMTAP